VREGFRMQTCDVQECLAYASFYWEMPDGSRAYRCAAHEYHLVPQGATRHEYHLITPQDSGTPHEYRIVPGNEER
jgi:hypothetical protein